MKKNICLITTFLLCAFLFAACAGESAEPKVSFDEMVSAVSAAADGDRTMIAVDTNYIKGSMKIDVDEFESYIVCINAYGANIDEYGIFKTSDAKRAKELGKTLDEYFKFRDDIWMPEYMPDEYPKLQNAEYMIRGNHVMYAILSEDVKSAAFKAFEDCFK